MFNCVRILHRSGGGCVVYKRKTKFIMVSAQSEGFAIPLNSSLPQPIARKVYYKSGRYAVRLRTTPTAQHTQH